MKIEKSIIKDTAVQGIKLNVNIVEPKGKANVRTLKPMVAKG